MAFKNQNASYLCDGTSALAPSYPSLTLIEGGKGREASPVQDEKSVACASFTIKSFAMLVLVAVMAFALCAFREASISKSVENALEGVSTTTVTVRGGDTLWGLAQDHSVTGVSTKDLVSWLEAQNNLDSAQLQPGQILVVPAGLQ